MSFLFALSVFCFVSISFNTESVHISRPLCRVSVNRISTFQIYALELLVSYLVGVTLCLGFD